MADHVKSYDGSIEHVEGFVFVLDRRKGHQEDLKLSTGGLLTFVGFKQRIGELLKIPNKEKFVITTTNRDEIKDTQTWDFVENEETLYVLNNIEQSLATPADERISYQPHFHTITEGGQYEYYASEGHNPLSYAFAELIDNALAATVHNIGSRQIELRLHFDETNPSKSSIFIVDNGKGMTSRDLNHWAIYRLSKHKKLSFPAKRMLEENGRESPEPVDEAPLSLNSDISFFGVGGKQAIFFIGNSTRMISKPKESKDVHELIISREEFEKREKNRESIYSGHIKNRQPGYYGHIQADEENVRKIIHEEHGKESFTVVVIQGISSQHIAYLKYHLQTWTRQLAHIYHYYIHGPSGNSKTSNPFKNIDIEVKIFTKGQGVPHPVINLRDIEDDVQSNHIASAASTFNFKATVEGTGIVEGIMRYHPFLYDKETFPVDLNRSIDLDADDENDYTIDTRPARGKRPVFECYWNGRLIPYTTIEEFEWCSPKKNKNIPIQCYNRISGVLFTNDKFQVTTNKLTFQDLEMKLRDRGTVFSRLIDGHRVQRTIDISKEFNNWLKECHEKCDKQVKFSGYSGTRTRPELPKSRHGPWSVYKSIEWDGKIYKQGQLVKIIRTIPVFVGTIKNVLLFGDHEDGCFATGGDIEVVQEPKCLYEDTKIVPVSKIDITASSSTIKKMIEEEEARLPNKLIVTWPLGDQVFPDEKRAAGKVIGDIQCEISNKKGEMIHKLPGPASLGPRKLLVELKITLHSPQGQEKVVISHISQHGKNWPFYFKKMENIRTMGNYTLLLQVVLNESGNSMFAGKTFPSHRLKFIVTEAEPAKFSFGMLDGPFRIGTAFSIPLECQDEFGHSTKPSTKLKPIIEAVGLDISYNGTHVKGNSLVLDEVIAKGLVGATTGKNFNLSIKIPGLEEEKNSLKIRMLPGPPHSIEVGDTDLTIENGNSVSFHIKVHDVSGNVSIQEKCVVSCKFSGEPGLPTYTVDCSSGQGVLTGQAIHIKELNAGKEIKAIIEIMNNKEVKAIEKVIRVGPSTQASSLQLLQTSGSEPDCKIENGAEITMEAGSKLEGLVFILKDEAARPITITPAIASKLKVNWTPKVAQGMILEGRLPDIKVPNSITDSKYCHLSLTGSSVDLSFTVKAVHGPPGSIKCWCQGDDKLRIGKMLKSHILVSLSDKFGNEIPKLPRSSLKDLTISGEGLVVEETLRGFGQAHTFDIEGIIFTGSDLGTKEVCVKYQDLTGYVRLTMVAGPPTKIKILDFDPNQALSVVNETILCEKQLIVQLCDEAGHPSPEKDVRVQLAKATGLKISPAPQPIKTDSKGQANFGLLSISGKRNTKHEIQPKAFFGRTIISGPKMKIVFIPDTSKPIRIVTDYDKEKASVVAGTSLPEFTVSVFAEDDFRLSLAKPDKVVMLVWKASDQDKDTTPACVRLANHEGMVQKHSGGVVCFFSEKNAPEKIGDYSVMFKYTYKNSKSSLSSDIVKITVLPDVPVKLVSINPPGTPTVSNTQKSSSRSLIRNLNLELRDRYDNPAGGDINGKVSVEITCHKNIEIPNLVGNTKKVDVQMINGKANLQNLFLQENTPGKDGQEYILRCSALSPSFKKNKPIPAFDVTFLFYNDAKKQSEMAALTKERDELRKAIQTYKSLFRTTQELIVELRNAETSAMAKKTQILNELRHQNIPPSKVATIDSVIELLNNKQKEKEKLNVAPKRRCGLVPAEKDPDVLGKIGHLAQVADNDIARVISWHMAGDMDCTVTMTTQKAKEIFRKTNGRNQLLSLDSIYRRHLHLNWDSLPLPHEQVPSLSRWQCPGNPAYAQTLLVFPHDTSNCKIVFSQLLGSTIILDTLDDATLYRKEIVKYIACPTILTREGNRIRSNGKFGGSNNKAPPSVEQLRGAIFGSPMPVKFLDICKQVDTLERYKCAFENFNLARADLSEQLDKQKDPSNRTKFRECQEDEERLKSIETRLGIGHGLQVLRPPPQPDFGEPVAKKARVSTSTTVISAQVATPSTTRASPRAVSLLSRSAVHTPTVSLLSKSSPTKEMTMQADSSTPTRQSARKASRGTSPKKAKFMKSTS